MIGSFTIYGLGLILVASAIAITCSLISLACLAVHFVFQIEGEPWPASTPRFRILLSAGALILLNVISIALTVFVLLPSSSEDLREGLDTFALFGWVPISILCFAIVYFCLGRAIPHMTESTTGTAILSGWAVLSGMSSLLIAVPFLYVLFVFITNRP